MNAQDAGVRESAQLLHNSLVATDDDVAALRGQLSGLMVNHLGDTPEQVIFLLCS